MSLDLIDFIAETRSCAPERLEQACQRLEALWPGEVLDTAISWREGAADETVADRPRYFRERLRTKTRWFALHGRQPHALVADPQHPADFGFLGFSGRANAGGGDYDRVAVVFPPSDAARVERLLAEVGDALRACTARWTPRPLESWQRVVQFGHRDVKGLAGATPAGLRLPALRSASTFALQSPWQPEAGGWLNYWSARTCEFLGWTDPPRDAAALGMQATPTPAGAWLVRLTPEAPGELDPSAMRALALLHERLPRLGLTSPP